MKDSFDNMIACSLLNNKLICYVTGNFDDWCVEVDGKRPRDYEYFNELKALGSMIGNHTIYGYVKLVFDLVAPGISFEASRNAILAISKTCGCLKHRVDEVLMILYFSMIAEEEKKNKHGIKPPIRKYMKLLGVYQVLIEGFTPEKAANFSYRVPSSKLLEELEKRGLANNELRQRVKEYEATNTQKSSRG